jgi:hypothetical protein
VNPLEFIKDKATGVWRTLKADEIADANEEKFSPNRAMRRAYTFGPDRRLTGPGYTRAFRKGRTQRVRKS